MPDLKKAELLNGMVYLAAEASAGRRIDRTIPPLENGDHLTRAEFERRWENMPDLKKAELINGMVFMPPPVSAAEHGIPHSRLNFWLMYYQTATPGVVVADNSMFQMADGDDSQPDAMMFILPEHGGGARFVGKGYVAGMPELVAEVAASSVSYDLNLKLAAYQRNRVREYVAWRTLEEGVDWFVLRRGRYVKKRPDRAAVYRSGIFPGLWLDAGALMRGDVGSVVRTLQLGLATAEHARFVDRLRRSAERKTAAASARRGRKH